MQDCKKKETEENKRRLQKDKLDAFFRLTESIAESFDNEEMRRILLRHRPAGDLKLAYQSLGGIISNLPDGK